MTITTEIKKLENIFKALNEKFYNNELVQPVITYCADESNKMIGWCTLNKVWYTGKEKNYEINISANMIKYAKEGACETMLHEMAHLYNLYHNIKDCSNSGFYHNKKYRDTATAHGLICERHDTYGYAITRLNDEAREFVKELEKLEMYYINPRKEKMTNADENNTEEENEEAEKKERVKRTFVYRCPVCGEEIKSKNPDGTYYDDCGSKFERVDE